MCCFQLLGSAISDRTIIRAHLHLQHALVKHDLHLLLLMLLPSSHGELAVSDQILLPIRRDRLLYKNCRKLSNPAGSGGTGCLLEVVGI